MTDRYAAVHAQPTEGPGDQRPTAIQIVKDNNLEGKLVGKVALITGVSSGIGIETAKALKATGARVFGAVRDLEKGKAALGESLEPGKLDLVELDLGSLESVRKAAKEVLSKTDTLNLLINNAGIMACPFGMTVDGFELQFGTNHIGHFLLFQLLKDTLLKSATPEFASRVVNVSSIGHRYSQIHFDNLILQGIYEPNIAYGQAKLSNIYMANEIDRRYGSKNLHAFSLHPGGIWTGLQKYIPDAEIEQWRANPYVKTYMKNTEQGAATQVWAALDKALEGKGGMYLEDCQISQPAKEGYSVLDPGYEKYTYDQEKEGKLWKVSLELLGLSDDQ